jgi:HlyD family secretion protein
MQRRLAVLVAAVGGLLGLVHATGCAPAPSGAEDASPPATIAPPTHVTALGRLEPRHPITRIAGPSRPSVVIAELLVGEDDQVEAGQPIAVLDSRAENEARVRRARAQLQFAQREYERIATLMSEGIGAASQRDERKLSLDVAKSDLAMAEAMLAQDTVTAPVDGQIVTLHARRGERVGPSGIAELAQNDQMYAIAEVYETDIGRVAVGQRARVESPALPRELTGRVERIGKKVGKLDLLNTDPVARTDARVVEVRIKLDESDAVQGLSNLQVDVTIEPASPASTADVHDAAGPEGPS